MISPSGTGDQPSRASSSCARARAFTRATKASRAGLASRLEAAMPSTTARVFLTRWFSSAISVRWCAAARTTLVTAAKVAMAPAVLPSGNR